MSGNLIPTLILRDFGGKPIQAGNLTGQTSRTTLQHTFAERAAGYTLEIRAAEGSDGTTTSGDYRAVIGLNAPDVLTGFATITGRGILQTPTDVQVGIRIERISDCLLYTSRCV